MTSRQELREKIVQLRKQRDSHQIDESDYIDGVMSEVDKFTAGVVGEDELHQDTSFGGTLPKFETVPMKHRNQLRAEQRKRAGL